MTLTMIFRFSGHKRQARIGEDSVYDESSLLVMRSAVKKQGAAADPIHYEPADIMVLSHQKRAQAAFGLGMRYRDPSWGRMQCSCATFPNQICAYQQPFRRSLRAVHTALPGGDPQEAARDHGCRADSVFWLGLPAAGAGKPGARAARQYARFPKCQRPHRAASDHVFTHPGHPPAQPVFSAFIAIPAQSARNITGAGNRRPIGDRSG